MWVSAWKAGVRLVGECLESRCAVAYYLFVIFYCMAFLNGHALLSLTLSMNIPATQYFFYHFVVPTKLFIIILWPPRTSLSRMNCDFFLYSFKV